MRYSVKFIIPAIAALIFALAGCSKKDSPASANTDPVADFSWTGSAITPATIIFVNNSTNADSYHWDFGDGRTSVLEAPQMDFADAGSYTITLIATASATSKADTLQKTLMITPGKCYLKAIFVDQIPFANPGGGSWDDGSGPDLYYDFLDGQGEVISTSSSTPIPDLTPGLLPVEWYFTANGIQLGDWHGILNLKLWDNDITTSELIGEISFSVNQLIESQGYAQSISLQNGSVRIRLTLAWQ